MNRLQRLKRFAEIDKQDFTTKEEVGRVIQSLVKAIANLKTTLTSQLEASKSELSDIARKGLNQAIKQIEALSKRLDSYSTDHTKTHVNLDTRITKLDTELSEVRDLIPPPYSDTELRNRIEEVAKTIPAPTKPYDDSILLGDIDILYTKHENLEREVKEIAQRPRGGGMTDRGIQYALNRIIQQVTPAGAINGSNTTFTVPSTIHAILSFELNSRVVSLGEYSITGSKRMTIEFDTAIPASYSGKSFVVTYV